VHLLVISPCGWALDSFIELLRKKIINPLMKYHLGFENPFLPIQ
jgi:hypothetical protein